MAYSKTCQWCMRYDCKEKGGIKEQCPVDRGENPDEETQRATTEHFKKMQPGLNFVTKQNKGVIIAK